MQRKVLKNNSVLLSLALSSTFLAPTSLAQSETSATPAPPPTGLVLRYLQQDVFVTPGTGFRRVRIGDTFKKVAKIWGQPKQTRRNPLTGTRKWKYEAGDKTILIVAGKTTVDEISVIGSTNSAYQSTQGARFGMTTGEVMRLYPGRRPPGKLKRLAYPRQGIAFAFESGKLAAMQVFPPRAH